MTQPIGVKIGLGPSWLMIAFIGIALGGVGAYLGLRGGTGPPPAEIAGDGLLVLGRQVYLDRCAVCHGANGLGDGPMAARISSPPVGNLADATWKHGDEPGRVFGVIRDGVKGTQMTPWGGILGRAEVRAVAAYVYHLAHRDVPAPLRVAE